MKISAVLFDVGGVLIELDGLPSLARLLQNGQTPDEIYKYWMASPSVIGHETGELNTDEFAVEVVKDLKLDLSPDAFMANFRTWIVGIFPDTMALLDAIPTTVKVAALSNTSDAHWQEVEKTGLTDKIEHLYLSHKIGLLKPHKAAFQAVVDDLGVPAEEIVFFDDTQGNVDAGNTFGMQSHLVFSPSEAEAVLKDYGVL